MQSTANQLPNAFIDNISATNTPAKIEVPVGQSINTTVNESKACLKLGRPICAKDKISRKRKAQENEINAPEEALPIK